MLVSSYVGRAEETHATARLLTTGRLVTVTGAPGVGKSRLAVAAATLVGERTRLVPLAPVTDPAAVPAAMAAELGVCAQPDRFLVPALVHRLRQQRFLLVLDDCEHVLDSVAPVLETLLGHCPELRVLVTSREALGVRGELTFPVPPLPVPPTGTPAERVGDYPSVQLFVQRASAVQPCFTLTEATAPAVGELCRRLDGLPLAIELAAAWIRVLSPAQLAGRLDDRFSLLTGGGRTTPPRHRSLRAAVEWSHRLLSAAERVALRRLSVFTSGCCLEAAEGVCAGQDLPRDRIVDVLAGLVSRSLVVADTSRARARYWLLETIRDHAAGELAESGETAALRDAHADWYTGLAEDAATELAAGPDRISAESWLERLNAELGNLRVALRHHLDHGDPERGLSLAVALSRCWRMRGRLREGRAWLERALDACPTAPAALRAAALSVRGALAWLAGEPVVAASEARQSLTLARAADDAPLTARALTLLGRCVGGDDPERARRLHHEAMRLRQRTGHPAELLASLDALAALAAGQGRGQYATRLLGAVDSLRAAHDCPRPADEQPGYDRALAAARRDLGPEEFATAWEQGGGLSLQQAVDYAAKGRGPRQRPATGWASLTKTEREVARLAGQGLTNPEIGRRLFVSRRTVQSHLANIYSKLGISSRTQLPRTPGCHCRQAS